MKTPTDPNQESEEPSGWRAAAERELIGLEDLQRRVARLFAENERLRSDTARLVAESRLHTAVANRLVRRKPIDDIG
ncbi:MAG: hypothetical protein AAGJ46_09675 [Planctomycetota bacterium]